MQPDEKLIAPEVVEIESWANAASKLLWDATEGQFHIANLYIIGPNRRDDNTRVDIDFTTAGGDSRVTPAGKGTGLRGNPNYEAEKQVNYWDDTFNLHSGEFAHELVHYVLACGDGYLDHDNPDRFCSDGKSSAARPGNMGKCMVGTNKTPTRSTLTQDYQGVSAGATIGSELCTSANHDPVRGCAGSNALHTAQSYTYGPADHTGDSCWETTEEVWNHASAPEDNDGDGKPDIDPDMPGGYTKPIVHDLQNAGRNVALVLDQSGSMGWASHQDGGEVCGDQDDNDGDGSVDESPCSVSRMKFMKAGARAWLQLAADRTNFNVSILSFTNWQTLWTSPKGDAFRAVTSQSVDELVQKVNSLTPQQGTAIGDALVNTSEVFAAESFPNGDDAEKWGILFSDGKHNTGSASPAEGIVALNNQNVHMNTVATGHASQLPTLRAITQQTNGAMAMMSLGLQTIVSQYALQMANSVKAEIYTPAMKWHLNANNVGSDFWANSGEWFQDANEQKDAHNSGTEEYGTFVEVVPETGKLTIVVAGSMDRMSEFGVELTLTTPEGAQLDTEQSTAQMDVHRDPYFIIVRVAEPASGEWSVKLRPADGSAEIQTGTLTVYGDSSNLTSEAYVNPPIVDSSSRDVRVDGFSSYLAPLVDFKGFGMSVEGPTGQHYGLSVAENRVGVLEGFINSLPYRGGYRVQTIFKSGANTHNLPGEPTPETETPVNVPTSVYGDITSFQLVDGQDPGLNFRKERVDQ